MKAILVVDIPDDIWANKEEDMGMYAEVWSKRIDDGWCGEYYADSLKPMPERIYRSIWCNSDGERCEEYSIYDMGYNKCIDVILGEEE